MYERYEDRTYVLAKTIFMMTQRQTIMTGYSDHESIGYLFDRFDSSFNWRRGTGSSANLLKLQRFANGLQNELVTDRKSTNEEMKIEFYRDRLIELNSIRDKYAGGCVSLSPRNRGLGYYCAVLRFPIASASEARIRRVF